MASSNIVQVQETASNSPLTISQSPQDDELPTVPSVSSNIIQTKETAPPSLVTTSQLPQDNEISAVPLASSNNVHAGPPRRKHYSGELRYNGNEFEHMGDASHIEQDLFDTPYVTIRRTYKASHMYAGLPRPATWETLRHMHMYLPQENLGRLVSDDDGLIYVSFFDTPRGEKSAEDFFQNGDETFKYPRWVEYKGQHRLTYKNFWKPYEVAFEYQHFPTIRHRRSLPKSGV